MCTCHLLSRQYCLDWRREYQLRTIYTCEVPRSSSLKRVSRWNWITYHCILLYDYDIDRKTCLPCTHALRSRFSWSGHVWCDPVFVAKRCFANPDSSEPRDQLFLGIRGLASVEALRDCSHAPSTVDLSAIVKTMDRNDTRAHLFQSFLRSLDK